MENIDIVSPAVGTIRSETHCIFAKGTSQTARHLHVDPLQLYLKK